MDDVTCNSRTVWSFALKAGGILSLTFSAASNHCWDAECYIATMQNDHLGVGESDYRMTF